MNHRRDFFTKLSALSAGLFAGRGVISAQQNGTGINDTGQMDMQHGAMQQGTRPSTQMRVKPNKGPSGNNSTPVPVTTLDVGDLPFTIDNGVKVFNLIAEPVKR